MDKHDIQEYMHKKLIENNADDVVVCLEGGKKTQVKFANNNIVATQTWDAMSMGIFASFKGKIIFTNLDDLNKNTADEKIKHILKFVKTMSPNQNYRGIYPGPFKYSKNENYDKQIENLSDKSVDLVEEGINSALNEGAKRASGVFEFGRTFSNILTSKGAKCNQTGTEYYFSIRAHTDKEASGYANQVGRTLKNCKPSLAGKQAGMDAVTAKNPEHIDADKYDMIMTPYPFANLLDNFGGSTSISAVEGGWSFLGGKLGKKIMPSFVSIYDDGLLKDGLGSNTCDAEGCPAQTTKIVDKGVLKTYIHNYSSATRYKTKTTGNAGLISPEVSNIVISPGKESTKKLYDDFTGLVVTNVWYTRFQNYTTGDFSTIPRDAIMLYKKGKFVKSVKDIRIADNLLSMFNSISKLSKERVQQNGWEVETPIYCGSALMKKVNVSRSTG